MINHFSLTVLEERGTIIHLYNYFDKSFSLNSELVLGMIHNIGECLILPNNACVPLHLTRCNGVLKLDIFST